MPKRGSGFTRGEVECLLDAIEKYLPIGMNEWEKVENYVSDRFPSESSRRTKESLKRKFSSLYRTRIPTGDPNCPPEVKRAKRLLEDIKNRADLTEGEDEEESEGEYGREGNEELFASDEDNNNTSFQLANDDLGRIRSEDNGELEEPVAEDALNHSGSSPSDHDLQEVRNTTNNNINNSTPAPSSRPPPLLRNASSAKELATPITRKGSRISTKKGMARSGVDSNGDVSFSDVMKYMMNKHDMEKEERMLERKERMEMEERRMQEEYRQRMELAQMQMQQQQRQQEQWLQMQMQHQQLMGMFMMSLTNTNAAQGRGYLPPDSSMSVLRNMPQASDDPNAPAPNDVNQQSNI